MSLFQLPETIDRHGAQKMAEALLQLRGMDLRVEGGAVQRFGALGAEALICAKKQWDDDGFKLQFAEFSKPAMDVIERLGLSDHFKQEA